jgi:hypothetical protein
LDTVYRPIHDFIPDLLDITASLRVTQHILRCIAEDTQEGDGVSSPLYIIVNKHLDHAISGLTKITGDDSVERYAKYYDAGGTGKTPPERTDAPPRT